MPLCTPFHFQHPRILHTNTEKTHKHQSITIPTWNPKQSKHDHTSTHPNTIQTINPRTCPFPHNQYLLIYSTTSILHGTAKIQVHLVDTTRVHLRKSHRRKEALFTIPTIVGLRHEVIEKVRFIVGLVLHFQICVPRRGYRDVIGRRVRFGGRRYVKCIVHDKYDQNPHQNISQCFEEHLYQWCEKSGRPLCAISIKNRVLNK